MALANKCKACIAAINSIRVDRVTLMMALRLDHRLRLYDDVEMAEGRWGAALLRYLCGAAAGSWHFAKRAPDEPSIVRRAARCCQALNSPTQAAALCQLPDEPDYTTAFKCLAEKTGTAADSMDGYYQGGTLSTVINLHRRHL